MKEKGGGTVETYQEGEGRFAQLKRDRIGESLQGFLGGGRLEWGTKMRMSRILLDKKNNKRSY